MKSALINSIQYQFNKLTNSSISQSQVKKFILPIIEYINYSPNNKFLLSGSQGVGKTTLLKLIKIIFKKKFNKKILSLSLDDFYLDKKTRCHLTPTQLEYGLHSIIYIITTPKSKKTTVMKLNYSGMYTRNPSPRVPCSKFRFARRHG